jgi:uncharacterized integral membrane protein (TIGR00698 family)
MFATLIPPITPIIALATGILFSMFIGNTKEKESGQAAKLLLQWAVALLGFGVNIIEIIKIGQAAFFWTLASIAITLVIGIFLGRILKQDENITVLLSGGTAICGGSAIAAIAPTIGAQGHQTAIALATVFVLNALGLLIFPVVGSILQMSEQQFGLWAALAIHDTSSVVGAAEVFGGAALIVGTTVKLMRALWIMPVSMAIGFWKKKPGKPKIPLFLVAFVLTATVASFIPDGQQVWDIIVVVARRLLTMTLFLIGATLTKEVLRRTGLTTLVHGVVLWIIVSVSSAWLIINGIISL